MRRSFIVAAIAALLLVVPLVPAVVLRNRWKWISRL
jgi:hypothetical protein